MPLKWWKLEEAYDQERQLRIEMSHRGRGNILAVMLNDTFDHTYNKSVVEMKKEDPSSNKGSRIIYCNTRVTPGY